MRPLPQSLEQSRDGNITYELSDGRRIDLVLAEVRQFGAAEIIAAYGLDEPTDPIPLMRGGRQIGTVPADFHPMGFESSSSWYDPRPHDFRMEDGKWIAHNSLGNGDIGAIPGFKPSDPQKDYSPFAEPET
jgi:hypothetical protein